MSETKKPALASAANYFNELREKGLAEERANKGYVWTLLIDEISHVRALGLADVAYDLKLNGSHVGETPYGVYRGEMAFDFNGDCSGALAILKMMGFSSEEDLKGWFKNDRFVMKLKQYDKTAEDEFIETFDQSKDAASPEEAVGKELLNSLIGAFVSSPEKDERDPDGLWYDWTFHMTEGDMGTYFKINGGIIPIFAGKSSAETDTAGSSLDVEAKAASAFTGTISERYSEPIDSPFPYTIKIYDEKDVLFTLYNAKGGPVTVTFKGTLSKIPVEDTIVVK